VSTTDRDTRGHLLAEVVATTFLIALIFALARSNRGALAAPAVGAYIGAAYWFTSSTSFANPAVTIGRVFTDTFAGIAPSSAPPFIVAQLAGLVVGAGVVLALYPDVGSHADDVVIPHNADAPDAPAPPDRRSR
jgi:glycerol uptake facilitator-like aquaporin